MPLFYYRCLGNVNTDGYSEMKPVQVHLPNIWLSKEYIFIPHSDHQGPDMSVNNELVWRCRNGKYSAAAPVAKPSRQLQCSVLGSQTTNGQQTRQTTNRACSDAYEYLYKDTHISRYSGGFLISCLTFAPPPQKTGHFLFFNTGCQNFVMRRKMDEW